MARMTLKGARSLETAGASMQDLRSAYTALRDVMQKRVSRLAEGTEAQRVYVRPYLPGGSKELKTLGQLKELPRQGWTPEQMRREMEMRVKELQILERSPRTSLDGWKQIEKQTIESLHKAGFHNINRKNIKQFGNFMEKMRGMFGTKFFPSDEVAELFDNAAGEGKKMDETELLGILDDLGADIDGVDLFAW